MKIQLLEDYRGKLTNEQYYTAGVYEEGGIMPLSHRQALVMAGRAVEVKSQVEQSSIEGPPENKAVTRKARK